MLSLKENHIYISMFTLSERTIAAKTSRVMGAVGLYALVPKYVASIVKRGETVLNYGAGRAVDGRIPHSDMISRAGGIVTNYDFPENSTIHDLGALDRKYDIVIASNVLNVQTDEMFYRTLEM